MAMKYWPFFLLFTSPTILAQEIEKLTKTVVEVQNALPTKEGASIASDLEDKLAEEDCPISPEQDEIDAKSSLPLNLKRSGWKVLFEVKYNPIQKQESTHQTFNAWEGMGTSVEDYLTSRGQELPKDLSTLNTVSETMARDFGAPNIAPEVYRNAMIIRHGKPKITPDLDN